MRPRRRVITLSELCGTTPANASQVNPIPAAAGCGGAKPDTSAYGAADLQVKSKDRHRMTKLMRRPLILVALSLTWAMAGATYGLGHDINPCGCYQTTAGGCICTRRGKCECPGECEPKGCDEKRQRELEREIKAETEKVEADERKRQAEAAERQRRQEQQSAAEEEEGDSSDDDSQAEGAKAPTKGKSKAKPKPSKKTPSRPWS